MLDHNQVSCPASPILVFSAMSDKIFSNLSCPAPLSMLLDSKEASLTFCKCELCLVQEQVGRFSSGPQVAEGASGIVSEAVDMCVTEARHSSVQPPPLSTV